MRSACWLVLLALVPAAQGALTLTATPPTHSLRPDVEIGDLSLVAMADCSDLVGRQADPTKPAQVRLEATSERQGTVITGPLQIDIPLDACTTPGAVMAQGIGKLQVGFTQAAPGETVIKVRVGGTLASGTTAFPELTATADAQVVASYAGRLEARIERAIVTTHGGQAFVRIEVRNLGNSLTNANFAVVGEPPRGLAIVPPTPAILESAAQGGAKTNATVQVLVRGTGSWREGAVQLRIVPTSTKDPALQGEPVTVNVLVRNGDLVLGVPAVGPAFAVALLACAAFVARRRP